MKNENGGTDILAEAAKDCSRWINHYRSLEPISRTKRKNRCTERQFIAPAWIETSCKPILIHIPVNDKLDSWETDGNGLQRSWYPKYTSLMDSAAVDVFDFFKNESKSYSTESKRLENIRTKIFSDIDINFADSYRRVFWRSRMYSPSNFIWKGRTECNVVHGRIPQSILIIGSDLHPWSKKFSGDKVSCTPRVQFKNKNSPNDCNPLLKRKQSLIEKTPVTAAEYRSVLPDDSHPLLKRQKEIFGRTSGPAILTSQYQSVIPDFNKRPSVVNVPNNSHPLLKQQKETFGRTSAAAILASQCQSVIPDFNKKPSVVDVPNNNYPLLEQQKEIFGRTSAAAILTSQRQSVIPDFNKKPSVVGVSNNNYPVLKQQKQAFGRTPAAAILTSQYQSVIPDFNKKPSVVDVPNNNYPLLKKQKETFGRTSAAAILASQRQSVIPDFNKRPSVVDVPNNSHPLLKQQTFNGNSVAAVPAQTGVKKYPLDPAVVNTAIPAYPIQHVNDHRYPHVETAPPLPSGFQAPPMPYYMTNHMIEQQMANWHAHYKSQMDAYLYFQRSQLASQMQRDTRTVMDSSARSAMRSQLCQQEKEIEKSKSSKPEIEVLHTNDEVITIDSEDEIITVDDVEPSVVASYVHIPPVPQRVDVVINDKTLTVTAPVSSRGKRKGTRVGIRSGVQDTKPTEI